MVRPRQGSPTKKTFSVVSVDKEKFQAGQIDKNSAFYYLSSISILVSSSSSSLARSSQSLVIWNLPIAQMMSHLQSQPSDCQSHIHSCSSSPASSSRSSSFFLSQRGALICTVSAGGRTRSHLDWLKSSSRPKSRTHFAFLQISICIFTALYS